MKATEKRSRPIPVARVDERGLRLWDRAAQLAGMTRSRFIRTATATIAAQVVLAHEHAAANERVRAEANGEG